MPSVLQHIIFDLGGVVFAWNPDSIIEAVIDDADMRTFVKSDIFPHPDWQEADRGTVTEAQIIERFVRRTDLPVATLSALMREAERSMQPIPGTVALMEELATQGFLLYCLSNMLRERYDYLRRTHDVWDVFSGVVISSHINLIKPEPGIYEHLLARYHLEPTSCVFIDDSPVNVEAARAIGMRGIVYTDATACREQLLSLLLV
jgi:putative hydrolase of the HAD superfamily